MHIVTRVSVSQCISLFEHLPLFMHGNNKSYLVAEMRILKHMHTTHCEIIKYVYWNIRLNDSTNEWHALLVFQDSYRKISDGMINTLQPRQNGCNPADDIARCISLNKNF